MTKKFGDSKLQNLNCSIQKRVHVKMESSKTKQYKMGKTTQYIYTIPTSHANFPTMSCFCWVDRRIVSCVSRKSGTGEGGLGHLLGDMHMLAVVAGCRNGLVGAGWANPCVGCTDVVGKFYSHLIQG